MSAHVSLSFVHPAKRSPPCLPSVRTTALPINSDFASPYSFKTFDAWSTLVVPRMRCGTSYEVGAPGAVSPTNRQFHQQVLPFRRYTNRFLLSGDRGIPLKAIALAL